MIDQILLENELMRWNKRLRIYPFEARSYIQRGMTYFKLALLIPSLRDFNQAEKLNPQLTPYLWQRGLTYYYFEKYAQGARQFELDLSIQSQDIEETLWHFLCIAQLENIDSAKQSLLPVKYDSRLIMRQIYQFFAGECNLDKLLTVGRQEGLMGVFYSNLYAGLYYEAYRNEERSQFHINEAIKHKSNNYMWFLACVHQKLRAKLEFN